MMNLHNLAGFNTVNTMANAGALNANTASSLSIVSGLGNPSKTDFSSFLTANKSISSLQKNEGKNTKNIKEDDKLNELKEKVKKIDRENNKSDDKKIESGKCDKKEIKEEETEEDEKEVNSTVKELIAALNVFMTDGQNNNELNINKTADLTEVSVTGIHREVSSDYKELSDLLNKDAVDKLDNEVLDNIKSLLEAVPEEEMPADFKKELTSKIDDILNKNNKTSDTNAVSLEDLMKTRTVQEKAQNSDSSMLNNGFLSQNGASKEEKFLNSLVEDKKDIFIDGNRTNLFAPRVQTGNVQGAEMKEANVKSTSFSQDLIKDIKYMAGNNIKELSVKVNAGSLGEITIKMSEQDGIMKAELKASSKETEELLLQNIEKIKKELEGQNIKIADVNVELYQEDTTFYKDGSFQSELNGREGKGESSENQNKASVKADIKMNSSEETAAEESILNNVLKSTGLNYVA